MKPSRFADPIPVDEAVRRDLHLGGLAAHADAAMPARQV
jgi:hypothetical protein